LVAFLQSLTGEIDPEVGNPPTLPEQFRKIEKLREESVKKFSAFRLARRQAATGERR
jgi:hypothetical protein